MVAKLKTIDAKEAPQYQKPMATSSLTKEAAAAKSLGVKEFLGDIKEEFGKISWTSQEELKAYTKMVVGMTLFFGLAVYVIDLCIHGTLGILAAFMRLLGA